MTSRCQFEKVVKTLSYDDAGPALPCANKAKHLMKIVSRDLGEKRIGTFKLCIPCCNIFRNMVDDKKFQGPNDGEDTFFATFQFREIGH